MMRRFGFAFVLLLLSCTVFSAPPAIEKRPGEMYVSIIQLIANPDRFNGENVAVSGYLELNSEYEHTLFVDEIAQKNGLSANSIAIDFEAVPSHLEKRIRELDRTYVIVAGKFIAGPTSFSGGRMQEVYRISSAIGEGG